MYKLKRGYAAFIAIIALWSMTAQPAQGQRRSANNNRLADRKNVLTLDGGLGAISFFAGSLSIQYERFITQDNRLSANVSLTRYYGGTLSLGGELSPGDPPRSKTTGWYAAPGVRYHPLGNNRRADLGLGGAIAVGTAHRRDMYRPDRITGFITGTDDHLFAAVLLQTNVNFHAHNGFVFGLFANVGYTLADTSPTVPGADNPVTTYFQFGIKMGGRW